MAAPDSTKKKGGKIHQGRACRTGRQGTASSCQPVSFPTRNTEICTYGPGEHGFDDTSTGQGNLNSVRKKMAQKGVIGEDQESGNTGTGTGGAQTASTGHLSGEEERWFKAENVDTLL